MIAATRPRSKPTACSPSRPTVCQLLHSLNVGGAEILAARIARQLGADYRMLFVCLDEVGPLGEELKCEGFEVHLLGRRAGFDLGCARRLAQIVQAEQVDILHAHQYTPFFYAMAAGWFRRRPGVLFTEHGRWHPDFPRRKRMIFNRLMLRRRDRVVGVGQAVRRALIDNEGLPASRVEVIYNGVDLEPFGANCPERDTVRRQIGCETDDLVLMQIARLDHLKDHETALRTLKRVCQSRPNAKLVLVGEGPERGKIESLVERHDLQSRVLMLGLRSDIPRLLSAADLFLLTSISEGIPLTLIEAMAAGVPVVSTGVGGVPEVIEDGRTGILAPAGDDVRLAEAIVRLATDCDLRSAMVREGRERAAELFSEPTMHAGYRRLYEEMHDGH